MAYNGSFLIQNLIAEAKGTALESAINDLNQAIANLKAVITEVEKHTGNSGVTTDQLKTAKTKLEEAKVTEIKGEIKVLEKQDTISDTDKNSIKDLIEALEEGETEKPNLESQLGLVVARKNLEAKLVDAGAVVKVATSTDGSDIEPSKDWTTQEALNAFEDAITTAKEVLNNKAATEEDVNGAVDALDTAIKTYKGAKKAGTKEVDKSKLEAKLEEAKAVVIVATSTDGSDIDQSEKWTTEDEKKAFEAAITAAEGVLNKQDATKEEVNGAVGALDTAIETYKGAKKAGTKEVDKSKLEAKLEEAKAVVIVATSTDGSDIDQSEKWTTEDEKKAFEAAITAAEGVLNKQDATKEEVNGAVGALDTAIETYKDAKKAGTKEVVVEVETEEELNKALKGDSEKIKITKDIEINSSIIIDEKKIINGNGKSISAANSSGIKSLVIIQSDGVEISNLTIDGSNIGEDGKWNGIYGIQVYDVDGIKLKDITIKKADAGLLVNASNVEVKNITTENNRFGGIEVSIGKGVNRENSKLTIGGTNSHNEDIHIWTIGEKSEVIDSSNLYKSGNDIRKEKEGYVNYILASEERAIPFTEIHKEKLVEELGKAKTAVEKAKEAVEGLLEEANQEGPTTRDAGNEETGEEITLKGAVEDLEKAIKNLEIVIGEVKTFNESLEDSNQIDVTESQKFLNQAKLVKIEARVKLYKDKKDKDGLNDQDKQAIEELQKELKELAEKDNSGLEDLLDKIEAIGNALKELNPEGNDTTEEGDNGTTEGDIDQ